VDIYYFLTSATEMTPLTEALCCTTIPRDCWIFIISDYWKCFASIWYWSQDVLLPLAFCFPQRKQCGFYHQFS